MDTRTGPDQQHPPADAYGAIEVGKAIADDGNICLDFGISV